MTPAPTRADLERLIAQLENWDAAGESGRLLLEAAVMLRALSPSVALEPPPEPGTWQCRKCGYNRTVGPTWACPTIGICEPAIAPLAELDALIAEFAAVRFGTGKSWKWANRAFNALAAMRAATGSEDAPQWKVTNEEICREQREYHGDDGELAATRIESLARENAALAGRMTEAERVHLRDVGPYRSFGAVIEHIISASVERGKSAGRAEAIAEAARVCEQKWRDGYRGDVAVGFAHVIRALA